MITKKNLLVFINILFYSCNPVINQKENNQKHEPIYDINIKYLYQNNFDKKTEELRRLKYDKNTLYINFESQFNNDTLDLFINREHRCKQVLLKSFDDTGFAKSIKFDSLNIISDVSFRINNGPLIYLETLNKNDNILGIRQSSTSINVVFYKKIPAYY